MMLSANKILPVFAWLALCLAGPCPLPAAEEAAPAAEAPEGRSQLLTLPIPVDREVKGLRIPYFTREGTMEMSFDASVARRIDDDHLALSHLRIELYDEEGKPDMEIRLPASVLDMRTEVISSEEEVLIKRGDFELHGEAMTFNTKTRVGKLTGRIRMVIYDRTALEDSTPPESD